MFDLDICTYSMFNIFHILFFFYLCSKLSDRVFILEVQFCKWFQSWLITLSWQKNDRSVYM